VSILVHYGIKRRSGRYPWGSGKDRSNGYNRVTDAKSPKELFEIMQNIKYNDFDYLRSPEEVFKTNKGECHSQSILEYYELKSMGYDPSVEFFIETNPKSNQGGMTHSFVWYKDKDKIKYFENAWEDEKGIQTFDSFSQLKNEIIKKHSKFESFKDYPNLEWATVIPENHKFGESLNDYVNQVWKDENARDKKKLVHYGIKRRSGRYPWGSGKDAYRRNPDFRASVLDMRKKGMKEKEIAAALGFVDKNGEGNIKRLRSEITLAKAKDDSAKIAFANRLLQKGYGYTKIAEIMKLPNESSVRSLLDPTRQERAKRLMATTEMLYEQLKTKPYLDIGAGIEYQVGVRRPLLDSAIQNLENEGYNVHYLKVRQLGTGKDTTMKVLTKADYKELIANQDKIRMIEDWSEDGGETFLRNGPVKNLDSSRVQVRFDSPLDGMIQLRRGVEDLSLGDKNHAQVRIEVDGTHYMKGMAVYKDDMPPGVDIIYNTNKKEGTKLFPNDKIESGVFKPNESDDPTNPFATTIRQQTYIDKDGNEQVSPLNRVGYSKKIAAGEEGYWASWNKDLSAQFLSKQPVDVAKEQLNLSLEIQKDRYNDIQAVTNSMVKQRLLDSFADDCDSKAVHLEGAALPRQSTKVIIGLESLKDNEVYAPTYKSGEELLLVRYPHAGVFEIPRVVVNNKNKEGIDSVGSNNVDMIGISPKAAAKLSGADFDGDHVIAIPYDASLPEHKRLQYSESLQGLKDFDPKSYKYSKDVLESPTYKKVSDRTKDARMGQISNLITDMTVKRASPDELARAVRQSMVEIDSQKHDLNAKQAAIDNRIAELKAKYQGGPRSGASTILSKANSTIHIDATRPLKKGDPGYENVVRRAEYSVDKETGRKVVVPIGPDTKTGFVKRGTTTRMMDTEDARTLMSKNAAPIERVYADFANEMKALGNQARKESISIVPHKYSPSAAKTYEAEVQRLDAALALAKRNAPKERQAQLLANANAKMIKDSNPQLTADQRKKIDGQQLVNARERVGSGKERIKISEREWEAIQAGAIRSQKLGEILSNTKLEEVQKLATPRSHQAISPSKVAQVKRMLAGGYSIDDVADHLGISTSSVSRIRLE
jgi:DNA-binding NarL/FixJ family response regulator